jgi:hypothetical protein
MIAGGHGFTDLRFAVPTGLAMIDVGNHPVTKSKKEAAMSRAAGLWIAMAALTGALSFSSGVAAQTAAAAENAAPTADNAVMLTVFLKHDQSRPLGELNAQLDRQGYYKAFPPDGVEVVSWYVMMGMGQVVTLRLPASRLREVNRILETTAWGSYRTEFYPTYDYKAIGIAAHDKAQQPAPQSSAPQPSK